MILWLREMIRPNTLSSVSKNDQFNIDSDEDEDEEDEIETYNPCFAINNLFGLILALLMTMLTIVPYWVDTNGENSSALLSDVRIFKGFFTGCLSRHSSQWQCEYHAFNGGFDARSMKGLQVFSASACGLSWAAWILSFYGSECLTVLSNQSLYPVKKALIVTAAVFQTIRYLMRGTIENHLSFFLNSVLVFG